MSEIRRIFSLSGETLIPLSCVGLILTIGYWVSGVDSRLRAAEMRMDETEVVQQKFQDFAREHMEDQAKALSGIQVQMAKIDARIEILLDIKKKGVP